MRIMAIDPGTEWIGIAGPDGDLSTIRIRTKERGRRCAEIRQAISHQIAAHPPHPALCALEGYAFGTGKLGLTRSAEARGAMLEALYTFGVAFVEIPPRSVKLFATGDGGASKEAMIAEAERRAFDCVDDEHQADAYHLRAMAQAAYGVFEDSPPLEAHQIEALGRISWPGIPERTEIP